MDNYERRKPRNPTRGYYGDQREIRSYNSRNNRFNGRNYQDTARMNQYNRSRYLPRLPYRGRFDDRNMRFNDNDSRFSRNTRFMNRNMRFSDRRYSDSRRFSRRHITKEELDENIKKYMRGEMMNK